MLEDTASVLAMTGWGFLAIGTILFLASAAGLAQTMHFLSHAQVGTAEVLSAEEVSVRGRYGREGWLWRTRIRLVDANGYAHIVDWTSGLHGPEHESRPRTAAWYGQQPYQPGQEVRVL
jgi:hypothetical protein